MRARTRDEQVAQIAASIREFGFTNPDPDRWRTRRHRRPRPAARGTQARHGRGADHRAEPPHAGAEVGPTSWRITASPSPPAGITSCCASSSANCRRTGFDLSLTGFDLDEIAAILIDASDGLHRPGRHPGRCPTARQPPRRRLAARAPPADLWGQHRRPRWSSACLLGTAAPDGHRSALRRGIRSRLAQSRRPQRDPPDRQVENDHRADWREAWALFPGEVAYVWHGALHADDRGRQPRKRAASRSGHRSSGPRTGW